MSHDRDLWPAPGTAVAPADAARLAWRDARGSAGRVRADHPPRRRAAARARLPRGFPDRPGRRLPAARGNRDAAPAAGRRRGDRDRGRPSHRSPRVRDRNRGDRGAGIGEARAGPAGTPSPARQRSRCDDDQPPGRRADRRPSIPDRDRGSLPRIRAPSLRVPKPRRHRQPPGRGAARTREPRPPLVSRGLGPRARGLALFPRRSAHEPGRDRGAVLPPADCPPRMPPSS